MENQEKWQGRGPVESVLSMALVNRNYVYEFASEAYCRLHGRARDEVVNNTVETIWGQSTFRNVIKRYLDRCFAGEQVHYESWFEIPGRGVRYYHVFYYPYVNERGEVTHAAVTSHDITDRKKEEDALQKSEAQFRTILKSMHYGVFTLDTEARFTFVNEVVLERSGYPQDWFMGKTYFDFVRPEDRESIQKNFQASAEGKLVPHHEFAYHRASGDIAWVQANAAPMWEGGHVVGVIVLLLDITKRKKSEQALAKSEERYRILFEDSKDAIYITDKEGRLIDVNMSYLNLFGYTKEEAQRLHAVDMYLDPKDRKAYTGAIEEEGFAKDFEIRLKKKDGMVMDCLVTGTLQRSGAGTVTGYQGIIRDVTEKKRMEKAIEDSEHKLKTIVYGSPIPQFVIDSNHRITHWNRALEVVSGLTAERMIGTNEQWRAFYKAERPCIADLLVDDAQGEMAHWYGEKYGESAVVDGAYRATDLFPDLGPEGRWLYFTAALLKDSNNNIMGAVETLEDITERKLAEEALRKTEEKYRNIVENAVIGIFQTTPEGRYMSVNATFARMMGFESSQDMIASISNIADQLYVNPEDRVRFREILERDGIIEKFETPHYRKDGTIVWTQINARAVKNQVGTVLYYEGTIEDVTSSRSAKRGKGRTT